MNFSQEVQNFTRVDIVPLVVSTVFESNTFSSMVLKNAKKFSSYEVTQPIKVTRSSTGGSFSGFDTFDRSQSNVTQKLTYTPKHYYQSVTLAVTDISYNETQQKVIDLIKFEMESAADDMAEDIGTLMYGDGTGNGGKDFFGLEGIDDDGTNVGTYFGLSRATYPTLNSTVDSSSNILSLTKLSSLYNAITDGSIKPSHIFADPEVKALYEELVQATQRIDTGARLAPGAGLKGELGFTDLGYKGMPFMDDRKAPSGNLYMLRMDDISFYANRLHGYSPVKMNAIIKGTDYSKYPFSGFGWSGWTKTGNQAVVTGEFVLSGQLTSRNPGRQGKLTGLTATS